MTGLLKAVAPDIKQTASFLREKHAAFFGVMNRKLRRLVVCFILISAILFIGPVCVCLAQGTTSSGSQSDDVYAADFSLKDLNGKEMKLSDYKGRVILLYFMATWCPECLTSIPGLKKIYNRYHEKGLVMININIQETQEKMAAYARKHSLPYPTLLDRDGIVSKGYGIIGVPVKILLDRDGRIICWNCRSLDRLLEEQLERAAR
jgi:peroxiredoxin